MLTKSQTRVAQKFQVEGSEGLQHWRDWHWQCRNSIRDLDTFERVLERRLPESIRAEFSRITEKFPMSITPYYLSLIDPDDMAQDPVFKQCFPQAAELDICPSDMSDPLSEDKDSPVSGITHRYPDRVLFLVSNTCAMYCRHCTRKRRVGDQDSIPGRAAILQGIDYIRTHPEVRDVLLSGGDPLLLSTDYLDWILAQIREIPHVEIIRIGSRVPVVLPYRINARLVNMLKRHHPLFLNTHFNHPCELTSASQRALAMLADAGIPLGNQSVLLAGVNDCPRIMRALVQKLVKNRVRPYYMYQCDLSEGLTHFCAPIGKGIEIMESLIGHTSGLCVPTYVIDAPGGGGKIPVMPNYLVSWSTHKVILRNYEGVITTYAEPDSYTKNFCDRDCAKCNLTLKFEDDNEKRAVGIERLLSDYDKTICLVPSGNKRPGRKER